MFCKGAERCGRVSGRPSGAPVVEVAAVPGFPCALAQVHPGLFSRCAYGAHCMEPLHGGRFLVKERARSRGCGNKSGALGFLLSQVPEAGPRAPGRFVWNERKAFGLFAAWDMERFN